MSAGAQAERIEPEEPTAGVRAAVDDALSRLPTARDLVVMAASWGDGPGSSVTPWVLEAIAASARHQGLQATGIDLADFHRPGGVGLRRRAVDAGLLPEPPAGRPIELDLPGVRRPRRIPATWCGRHLCLVVPMVHRRESSASARWSGPLQSAWAQLDRACAGPRVTDAAETGAKLAATVFASTTIVIDGSWWAFMNADDPSPAELLAVGRCICLSRATPSSSWTRRSTELLDRWIAGRLGLDAARGEASAFRVAGSGAGEWPRAPKLPAGAGGSLANQAIEALWRAGRKRRAKPTTVRALAPRVPGPLARCWQERQAGGPRSVTDPQ